MEMDLVKKIKDYAFSIEDEIKQLLKDFINMNSVNPRQGGPGEGEVAKFLFDFLKQNGFDDVEQIDAEDPEYGKRPNIIATLKGKSSDKKIWLIAHMDKVPVGDISLWETDPFKAVEKDGKIIGRGSEDNGQSLVSSIFSAIILKRLNIKPVYDLKICLVSDEETGSQYGIKYLADLGLFSKNDLVIVPDAGEPDGDFIEIAEKSILWLNFTSVTALSCPCRFLTTLPVLASQIKICSSPPQLTIWLSLGLKSSESTKERCSLKVNSSFDCSKSHNLTT